MISDADLAERFDLDGDGAPRPSDCDDSDPAVGAPSTWYADADSDGYGTASTASACAAPDGFAPAGGDCDDSRPGVNPGGVELCNGQDDDCDGKADGADSLDAATWYPDDDADGFGDETRATVACEAPADTWILAAGDCDDASANAFPGGTETWYDGIDGDCLGGDDFDADADGHASDAFSGEDCDDADAWVNPDRPEACGDGVDNDCDGVQTACAWDGDLAVEDADSLFWSGANNDSLGASMTFVGDTDGDGRDDLLLGASYTNSSYGVAWLVRTPAAGEHRVDEAAVAIRGMHSGSYTGWSVAAAGDVDADGLADLWVGARTNYTEVPEYSVNAGVVYLVHGPVDADLTLGDSTDAVYGTEAQQQLGSRVAAGEITGDGAPDMAAWFNPSGVSSVHEGGVVVVSGHAGGRAPSTDGAWIVGEKPGDYLAGHALEMGQDIDGDGIGDLVTSARFSAADSPSRVYVLPGPADTDGVISDLAIQLEGESRTDGAGYSLALPGDSDGDGYGDLLVGAYGSGTRGQGAVYVVRGPVTDATALANVPDRLLGSRENEALGYAVDGGGDVNGDGRGDLVVSSPGCSGCGDVSVAWVVLSPLAGSVTVGDAALASVVEPAGSPSGAVAIALGGDIDGDGGVDLAVARPSGSYDGVGGGVVYLFLGGPP